MALSKPSRAVTRSKATSAEVETRIGRIRDMMRTGEWVRGKSSAPLADEWGMAVSSVEGYAAEAWRRVCAEADDAEQARPTIAGTLAVSLEQAATERQYRAVAALADTWSRVVGARAPERVEHAVVVAQYEALPREGKVAWLRERAERMLAEAARLEGTESETDMPDS